MCIIYAYRRIVAQIHRRGVLKKRPQLRTDKDTCGTHMHIDAHIIHTITCTHSYTCAYACTHSLHVQFSTATKFFVALQNGIVHGRVRERFPPAHALCLRRYAYNFLPCMFFLGNQGPAPIPHVPRCRSSPSRSAVMVTRAF